MNQKWLQFTFLGPEVRQVEEPGARAATCPGAQAAGCCSLFQLTGESDLEKKKGKKMWREGKSIPLPYLRPKILGYSQLGRVPGSQTGPTHPWDRSLFFSAAQDRAPNKYLTFSSWF